MIDSSADGKFSPNKIILIILSSLTQYNNALLYWSLKVIFIIILPHGKFRSSSLIGWLLFQERWDHSDVWSSEDFFYSVVIVFFITNFKWSCEVLPEARGVKRARRPHSRLKYHSEQGFSQQPAESGKTWNGVWSGAWLQNAFALSCVCGSAPVIYVIQTISFLRPFTT